jgi:hypothetical protein
MSLHEDVLNIVEKEEKEATPGTTTSRTATGATA